MKKGKNERYLENYRYSSQKGCYSFYWFHDVAAVHLVVGPSLLLARRSGTYGPLRTYSSYSFKAALKLSFSL